MLGCGFISGIWAFSVGHTALKGVTQPDVHPISKMKGRKGRKGTTSPIQGAMAMLKEEDILTSVKAWVEGKGKHPKPEKIQDDYKNSKQTPAQKPLSAEGDPSGLSPITPQNQWVNVLLGRVGSHYIMKLQDKP